MACSSKEEGEAAAKPSPIDVISELREIVAGLASGLRIPMANSGYGAAGVGQQQSGSIGAFDVNTTTTGQELCVFTTMEIGASQHATMQVRVGTNNLYFKNWIEAILSIRVKQNSNNLERIPIFIGKKSGPSD